jgi:hypothetical protein
MMVAQRWRAQKLECEASTWMRVEEHIANTLQRAVAGEEKAITIS